MILDGSGACPREDGDGLKNWEEEVEEYKEGGDDHDAVHHVLATIYHSANYKKYMDRLYRGEKIPEFDPDRFDKEEAIAELKDALSLPMSHRAGARQYTREFFPGAATDFFPQRKKEFKMRTEMDDGRVMTESTTGKRDGISARACSNCGTPHHLSLYVDVVSSLKRQLSVVSSDTACRSVYYCGAECQTVSN